MEWSTISPRLNTALVQPNKKNVFNSQRDYVQVIQLCPRTKLKNIGIHKHFIPKVKMTMLGTEQKITMHS